jgi:hypothetical protein
MDYPPPKKGEEEATTSNAGALNPIEASQQ